MNYDDERTNRVFSIFLIGVCTALLVGIFIGSLFTFMFFNTK